MSRRLLLIDDDAEFTSITSDFLISVGYDVLVNNNGVFFQNSVAEFSPDVILMDRNLPGSIDGLELIRQIRKTGYGVPVIFITSLISDEEVIEGLEMYNCEYIKKPFGLKELRSRIDRILHYSELDRILFSNNCYIAEKCAIKNGDKIITLPKNENTLLKLLMDNQEKICPIESIIYTIWGDKDVERLNRVDVLVNKLREKIKGLPYVVENQKRIGYVLKWQGD